MAATTPTRTTGTTLLSANDLEAIRQDAADRGDCDTSSLANVALWGTTDRARRAANRKLAKAVR